MIGLGSDKNRLISTTGEGKLNWWRITERIAMAVMHYCFNNMFSIVNIVKVDSKRSLCRILGIAKKNSFVPANLFFRPPFWTKIQNCKTSNVKQFVFAAVTHAFFLVIWCHVRRCAEIWWMFQIDTRSIPRWPSRTGVGTSCFGAFSLFSTSWKELSSKLENNLEWSLKRQTDMVYVIS